MDVCPAEESLTIRQTPQLFREEGCGGEERILETSMDGSSEFRDVESSCTTGGLIAAAAAAAAGVIDPRDVNCGKRKASGGRGGREVTPVSETRSVPAVLRISERWPDLISRGLLQAGLAAAGVDGGMRREDSRHSKGIVAVKARHPEILRR